MGQIHAVTLKPSSGLFERPFALADEVAGQHHVAVVVHRHDLRNVDKAVNLTGHYLYLDQCLGPHQRLHDECRGSHSADRGTQAVGSLPRDRITLRGAGHRDVLGDLGARTDISIGRVEHGFYLGPAHTGLFGPIAAHCDPARLGVVRTRGLARQPRGT